MAATTLTIGKIVGTGASKLGSLAPAVAALGTFCFVFQVFLRQRDVLLTLVASAVLTAVVARRLAGRWSRPTPLVVAALLGLAVIPAFTLVPDLGYGQYGQAVWMASRIRLELGSGWQSALSGWTRGTDGPLNVALFLPAGLFLTAATRRPGRVLFALAGLSLAVEVMQAWSGLRSGTPQDLGSNVLGASIGIGIGMLVNGSRKGFTGGSSR